MTSVRPAVTERAEYPANSASAGPAVGPGDARRVARDSGIDNAVGAAREADKQRRLWPNASVYSWPDLGVHWQTSHLADELADGNY